MRRLAAAIAVAVVMLAMPSLAEGATLPLAEASAGKAVPFQRGVTLGEWGRRAYPKGATERTMRRLRDRYGVRWVTLFVVWWQPDIYATTISPGADTVTTPRLVRAIRIAHRLGLKVILRPYPDIAHEGGWRGQIEPTSVADWFASYDSFILRYAQLAEREQVAGFVLGSEMPTMDQYEAEWQQLTAAVRSVYDGLLTYEAHWEAFPKISWWSDLDAIDISAYFPLAAQWPYSVDDLAAGWHNYFGTDWFGQIEAIHEQTGLPVFFGEIGYRPVEGSATAPWSIDLQGEPSVAAQRIAYQAALRTWYDVPWFRGFHWWYVPTARKRLVGERGADHAPAEPALKTMGRWYGISR